MKTIRLFIILTLCGIAAYFFITQSHSKQPIQNPNESDGSKVILNKRFDEKGQLKADVETINGVNHGKAHNYYPNGSVHSEITYLNGLKEGNSIWYYQNGKPYRITPFTGNKKQGIQQRFYETGKIMSEVPYRNDSLLEGTKEYSEHGQLLVEKIPFQIKRIPSKNENFVFIEIMTKKLDVIEEAFAKYTFQGKTMVTKASKEGKKLIIPVQTMGNLNPPVTVTVIYKTKMNNLKLVSSTII